MKSYTQSILVKLTVAFVIVSLAGIAIITLLAGRVTGREFGRFANDTVSTGLVNQMVTYYQAHNSWVGADALLIETRNTTPPWFGGQLMLADSKGVVQAATTTNLPAGPLGQDQLSRAYVITVNGQTTGYLVSIPPEQPSVPPAAPNIRRVNTTLLYGAIGAALLALIIGWLLARNITHPLQELTEASRAIADGQLEKRVPIRSGDEIGKLAESFNAMSESLKKSRDLRHQMTADIAHELRNPLSIILGHTEALSEGVLPPTSETLNIIYDEARHLAHMVEDLRTLSLSEAGELPMEYAPTEIKPLLERAALSFAPRAIAVGVNIETNAPDNLPQAQVDSHRMGQVLANLLDNALKHTPPGGTITLSAATEHDEVVLRVQDTGTGITAEELPLLFTRFHRGAGATNRIQDGTGLGLAISKAIVELHGGQINVESAPGEGATFTIRLKAIA